VIVEEEVIVKETVGAEGDEEVAVKDSTPSPVEDVTRLQRRSQSW
jgi:hypothetical protein